MDLFRLRELSMNYHYLVTIKRISSTTEKQYMRRKRSVVFSDYASIHLLYYIISTTLMYSVSSHCLFSYQHIILFYYIQLEADKTVPLPSRIHYYYEICGSIPKSDSDESVCRVFVQSVPQESSCRCLRRGETVLYRVC